MDDQNRTRLSGLISGYFVSQAITCAARLRIADYLADGPKSSDELATRAGCSPTHLHRLICALAGIGVFRFTNRLVAQTPMSELLRSDIPHGLHGHALFHGTDMYNVLSGLYGNIVTGKPAWEAIIGKPLWSYLSERPQQGAMFDASMRNHQSDALAEMVVACSIGVSDTVVDVGGGDGALLHEVLRQHPGVQGILLDTPAVIGRAAERYRSVAGMDRCVFHGGDMFSKVPAGADVYLLKHVLHDWENSQCERILASCREAMSIDSRLIVIELPMGGVHARHDGWRDLSMMVIGGRERVFAEYEDLLRKSGMTVAARHQAEWGDVITARLSDQTGLMSSR